MIDRDFSREYPPVQSIPSDLVPALEALKQVVRYQVPYYPIGIFASQNVNLHTRRVAGFALKEGMPTQGERRILIHDIPEIKIGDLLVVETVSNPKLQSDKDTQEFEVAKELLNPRDQQLLQEFNRAGDFWKGKTRDNYFLAISGKIADIVDGNVIFHEIISQYCIENGCGSLDPRMNPSFHYAFNQALVLRRQLEFVSERQRAWFARIINLQFAYINYYWQNVPQNLIPPALQEELAKQ